MIAPIFLPFLAFFSLFVASPAPILEWSVESCDDRSCKLHLELIGSAKGNISKLSLAPSQPEGLFSLVASDLECDDHWTRQSTLNWMWAKPPAHITLDVEVLWEHFPLDTDIPSLEVLWEHVEDGERQSWNLGSVLFSRSPQSTESEPQGFRSGTTTGSQTFDMQLRIEHVPVGAFVKWTEYIPEGCVCEVNNPSGASLRKAENRQIFLWFERGEDDILAPEYRIRCSSTPANSNFDGELEVAFGTGTKTSHIAGVEWTVDPTAWNENMNLNPTLGVSSDASTGAAHSRISDTSGSHGIRYAVQLLANHRDLSPAEVTACVGYDDTFQIIRHEGWHKYLTVDKATYAEARALRSEIWNTTLADDAFVTAALDGNRITVQEALLMSNQSWMP